MHILICIQIEHALHTLTVNTCIIFVAIKLIFMANISLKLFNKTKNVTHKDLIHNGKVKKNKGCSKKLKKTNY